MLADCPCGLLLVSHDRTFLDRLARQHRHISAAGNGQMVLKTDAGRPIMRMDEDEP